MWKCDTCDRANDESANDCWSCGTAKHAASFEAAGNFPESTTSGKQSSRTLQTVADEDVKSITSRCPNCGATKVKRDISVSSDGKVGLDYRSAVIFGGCEPILADLCMKCGTIIRLHVRETNRNWITK